MYEEIFELINKGEINKAQEQIEKISDDDPKKYNLKGLIHFNKKELEKAKEQFEKGLTINPVDSDLLFNYGYLLKEMNQESQAWRYLMRIHDKDWATYDLLGDIEFKNRSKLASLRFYLKAAELTDNPQMKKKFLEIRNKVKKDTRIAFLCLPGLDNFLKDIVETFSLGYDVKLVVSTDGNEITQAIRWADIVWLEWANDLAVFATNKVPEIANKKVICRLHGYEIFSKFPEKINWELVDKLMFVNEHKKELFGEIYPKVNVEKIVIKNGIDLDKFTFKLRKKNHNLLIMGNINYRKGFETLLLSFQHLLETDNKYTLYIKGIFQDLRYRDYILNIIKEMKIENNIIFIDQYIDDIDSWGERFGYILSTSIEESFHYTIGEFMSKGIKPVINSWPSAREIWPNECIFTTVHQFQEKILEDKYDSESYRRFIEDNYTLERQIYEIEEIVENIYKYKSFKKKSEDMENCLVTIGVTNYNSEKYVKEFLNSVINQTFKNIELIIVDDHSIDKSVEIIKEYERKYNFIKLIEHEVNKGCPDYGRNEILSVANGKYVLFLDSDDKFTYNYSLEKLVDFIQRNKELDYVYTDYAIIDGNSKITNKWESKVFTKEEIIRTVFNRMGSGILPGKGLFKVDFFRRFNINYPINGTAADTLLSLICLKNNMKYGYLKDDLISYRIHDNNFTMNKQKRLDSLIPIIDYILENFWETLFPQASKETVSFELYSYFKKIFYTYELELWKPWGIDYANFHYTSVDYSKLVNIIRKYSIIHEKYKEKYEFLADYIENLNTRKYKPLVSILIPTYNLNNFFKQAFESALSQSYPNIEILVSDDSTEPAIEEYIQDFLANYKGDKVVKFYKHTNNIDWEIKNHENLLEKASGEYISFLHQDDLIHKEKVRLMMHFFILEVDVSLVTSYRVLIDKEGKRLEDSVVTKRITDNILIEDGQKISRLLFKKTVNFIDEPSMAIFKKQGEEVISKYHQSTVRYLRDYSLWLNSLEKGRFVYIPVALNFTRKHESQNSHKTFVRLKMRKDISKYSLEKTIDDLDKTFQEIYREYVPEEAMMRSKNEYYECFRPEVQSMVNSKAKRILDVGCAAGFMGAELKSRLGAEVWGVEIVEDIAKEADKKLDKVIHRGIEEAMSFLPEHYFDTIILADVLEHLPDPYKVLKSLKTYLAPNGEVIASIPNVRHWSVLKELLEGRWNYQEAGILDRTHLRFFTKTSIVNLFHNAGFNINEFKAKRILGTGAPEELIAALAKTTLDVSTLKVESSDFQYLIKAKVRESSNKEGLHNQPHL